MALHVDQLADELGLSRAEMNRCLRTLRVRSSSLTAVFVSDQLAREIRTQLPSIRARWAKQDEAAAERADRALTTSEAAAELGLSPDRIRQWASRGHITPVAQAGRNKLYRLGDLEQVRREAVARSHRRRGGAFEEAADLDKLVPTAIAARIAHVSPSTIRGWVQRGHLRPVGRHRRRLVFTIRDVIAAANR